MHHVGLTSRGQTWGQLTVTQCPLCVRNHEEKLQAESSEEPYLRRREMKGVWGEVGPTRGKPATKPGGGFA